MTDTNVERIAAELAIRNVLADLARFADAGERRATCRA